MNRRVPRLTAVALIALVFGAAACSPSSQEDSTERDADGQVVDGGDVGVFRLREGDCVDLDAFTGTEEIEGMGALPCDDPHTGEVILVDDEYFADLAEFPGVDAGLEQATPSCIAALDAFTGTDFETSNFDVVALVPTEPSWTTIDDRGLICIGLTLDGASGDTIATTGSMRVGG